MSSGYIGCWADVIEEKDVCKICPAEYDVFMISLENESIDIEAIARDIQNKSSMGSKSIEKAYNTLIKKFNQKTGLTLDIAYHDSDNDGNCHDEVDGVYWCVGEAWKYSPAGEKYKYVIERKTFVMFG
jgi:hypothetical protein